MPTFHRIFHMYGQNNPCKLIQSKCFWISSIYVLLRNVLLICRKAKWRNVWFLRVGFRVANQMAKVAFEQNSWRTSNFIGGENGKYIYWILKLVNYLECSSLYSHSRNAIQSVWIRARASMNWFMSFFLPFQKCNSEAVIKEWF